MKIFCRAIQNAEYKERGIRVRRKSMRLVIVRGESVKVTKFVRSGR